MLTAPFVSDKPLSLSFLLGPDSRPPPATPQCDPWEQSGTGAERWKSLDDDDLMNGQRGGDRPYWDKTPDTRNYHKGGVTGTRWDIRDNRYWVPEKVRQNTRRDRLFWTLWLTVSDYLI